MHTRPRPLRSHLTTRAAAAAQPDALVSSVRLLCRTHVGSRAVVLGCGVVTCSPEGTSFGNGLSMPLGVEAGGRDTLAFAELSPALAAEVACRRDDRAFQAAYAEGVQRYAAAARSALTILEPGAQLLSCSRVADAYVGPAAVLDGSRVERASLLSLPDERTRVLAGSVVRDALLQWGAVCDSGAVVTNSVMAEHRCARGNCASGRGRGGDAEGG